jgi:hypothetical protein
MGIKDDGYTRIANEEFNDVKISLREGITISLRDMKVREDYPLKNPPLGEKGFPPFDYLHGKASEYVNRLTRTHFGADQG